MDENHYNFIKRQPKLQTKPLQNKRSVLDKIQNIQKPTIPRPNSVNFVRSLHNDSVQDQSKEQGRNSQINLNVQIIKPEFQISLPIKPAKTKRRFARKSHLKSENLNRVHQFRSGKCTDTPLKINQSFTIQEQFYHNDKEKNAIDNLCHLSLDEPNVIPSKNYLSAWTNSYPVRESCRRQKQQPPKTTGRATTPTYAVRYPTSRNSINCYIQNLTKQEEQIKLSRQPLPNSKHFPQQIKKLSSYRQNSQNQNECSSRKNTHQDRMIFFRNGIIKHLRKKQNVGRHTVNQQWGNLLKNHDNFTCKHPNL